MKPCAGDQPELDPSSVEHGLDLLLLFSMHIKHLLLKKKKKKLPNRKDKIKKMEGRNDNQFEEYPDEKSMFTFHVCSCGY